MDVSITSHNHEEFLAQFPLGSFLQGRFWKRFLTLQGKKSWQLNVYQEGKVIAHALVYTNKLFLGKSYLYSPKGPLIIPTLPEEERTEALELLLSQVRDITIATRRREEIFCRIEPNVKLPSLPNIPMQASPAIQPKATIYIPLIDRAPEDVFKNFKEKTSYNIRLAEKKGVTVHWSTDEDGLKIFLRMLNYSKRRNHIRSHARRYYGLLLKADTEHNVVQIAWASYNGKPIAANLYLGLYPTMTYLHGGFNYRYRQLMAPHLLQWEAIKRAYELKLEYFDFWGYVPSDGSKPSLANVSKFKEGFGGKVVESPGTFDYIYNPTWYSLYEKARSIRRILPL